MIQLFQDFFKRFRAPAYDEYKLKDIKDDSQTCEQQHDLGHASKCVWELDKEA